MSTLPEKGSQIKALLENRSLILTGITAVGKSTLARLIAPHIDLPFYDSDQEIKYKTKTSISEIFSQKGEDYFRQLEHDIVKNLLQKGPMILALGGGAFMHEKTRNLILSHHICLWLKCDPEHILARTKNLKQRPLLQTANPKDALTALLMERTPIYQQAHISLQIHPTQKQINQKNAIDHILTYLTTENKKSNELPV